MVSGTSCFELAVLAAQGFMTRCARMNQPMIIYGTHDIKRANKLCLAMFFSFWRFECGRFSTANGNMDMTRKSKQINPDCVHDIYIIIIARTIYIITKLDV